MRSWKICRLALQQTPRRTADILFTLNRPSKESVAIFLGMYTVCTLQLSKAINFAPLIFIPRYFIYLALAGWAATFRGIDLRVMVPAGKGNYY
jgi:hypothetical protein